MEVSIFEAAGLPEGAILSVRAGSTRRQAPVPLAGPLRFPNLPFNAKQFKVDVMQTLGSSKVEINANKELESYSLSVDIGGGQQARVGFTVREQPSLCGKRACELKQVDKNPEGILEEPAPVPLPPEKARAALDSRSYAREHNIPNLVQEMLQHVLREKPDAPFMVMSEYFKRKGEEMGEKPEAYKLPPMTSERGLAPMPPGPAVGTMGGAPEQTMDADPFLKDPFAKDPFAKDTFANTKDPYARDIAASTFPKDAAAATTKDPVANTQAMMTASDPAAQERQRQLQSQMTYPGEYYVPNIPGEDPQKILAKVPLPDPLPTEFPEDPAAHIQKAPPPPPMADARGLPPPMAEARGLPPSSLPPSEPVYAPPQQAALPPTYPSAPYYEAKSVPTSYEKVAAPQSKAATRGDNDPERLRLEAEHLSLQAEKSSLLRELEILTLQQGGQVPQGARA